MGRAKSFTSGVSQLLSVSSFKLSLMRRTPEKAKSDLQGFLSYFSMVFIDSLEFLLIYLSHFQ